MAKGNKKSRLSAYERLDLLMDKNSFTELDEHVVLQSHQFNLQEKKQPKDGVVTGFGTIHGRKVCIYAQDFSFMGGSMGEMHNQKIAKVMEYALMTGIPIIGLLDSGGARIQEGIQGLEGGGKIFKLNTLSSGVIPQISAILGPCAGIAVYSPALTDFTFMVEGVSNMFITGPNIVKTVTGEDISFEDLGGANVHAKKSGVAHFTAASEKECLARIKKLLSYLPSNNLENPPFIDYEDSKKRKAKLKSIIPSDPKKSYDVKEVIQEVMDKDSFCEVMEDFAQNAVTGFARLDNKVVAIIANQPMILAGCLDINSSDKIARFVRCCDAFNIPIINLVDVTGYLPGTDQEHQGIIRHGAKMLYSYAEATVPKISLVMRKAYGGAYIALASKEMAYDYVLSWPSAEIAVMGAEQAVNLIHRKEIAKDKTNKKRNEYIKQYQKQFLNPDEAARTGKIDKIIDPEETRIHLIRAIELLEGKRVKGTGLKASTARKHGNIPL